MRIPARNFQSSIASWTLLVDVPAKTIAIAFSAYSASLRFEDNTGLHLVAEAGLFRVCVEDFSVWRLLDTPCMLYRYHQSWIAILCTATRRNQSPLYPIASAALNRPNLAPFRAGLNFASNISVDQDCHISIYGVLANTIQRKLDYAELFVIHVPWGQKLDRLPMTSQLGVQYHIALSHIVTDARAKWRWRLDQLLSQCNPEFRSTTHKHNSLFNVLSHTTIVVTPNTDSS